MLTCPPRGIQAWWTSARRVHELDATGAARRRRRRWETTTIGGIIWAAGVYDD